MSVYEFGPFQLDIERLLLLHGGSPVALGPKVVETLLALIEHPGDVLSKSALLDRIWPEGFVEEANLAQNVYVLRKALRMHWAADAIDTVPRRGYRFTAPVRLIESVPGSQPEVTASPSAPNARPRFAKPRWVAAAAAVAVAIVSTVAIVGVTGQRHASTPALSATGSRLYEIGRYYWNLRTRDGVQKSLTYYAQVVDSDPHKSQGYAALAEANATMGDYHYGAAPPSVYFNRAFAYAEKALQLDPQSAEAHAALGMIALDRDQYPKALAELRASIELDPQYGPAHEWYGIALMSNGKLHEGFSELETASNLDPLSVSTTAWLSSAAYMDRRFDEAIAYSKQTLDLSPQRADVYATIGLTYEARGDFARAIDNFKHFERLQPEDRPLAAAYLAHAYALAHRLPEARAELAYALAHAKDVSPQDLAIALAAVGERTVAIGVLRHVHGSQMWNAIANDPRYDILRNEPQFKALDPA